MIKRNHACRFGGPTNGVGGVERPGRDAGASPPGASDRWWQNGGSLCSPHSDKSLAPSVGLLHQDQVAWRDVARIWVWGFGDALWGRICGGGFSHDLEAENGGALPDHSAQLSCPPSCPRLPQVTGACSDVARFFIFPLILTRNEKSTAFTTCGLWTK